MRDLRALLATALVALSSLPAAAQETEGFRSPTSNIMCLFYGDGIRCDFPVALIVWGVAFLIYQQVQDRVIQPIFYKNAVRIHPVVAIAAVLAGAQLAGILGALLAIPVAAALGVIYDELWPAVADPDVDGSEDEGGDDSAEPAPSPAG